MSKKKRVRRDIEKFSRGGRHWELLRLLEEEDLVSAHAREYQDASKGVIKSALKDSKGFHQFLHEVGALQSPPATPDFRFLTCLAQIMEDREPPEDPLQLKGLSPEAERLRSRLAVFSAFPARLPKLRALLAKFALEPEKITRRCYEDLASLIPEASLAARVRQFGELIPSARLLNGKAAVARGWGGVDTRRLYRLCEGLERSGSYVPEDLQEVLVHPFIHNLAVMCRRLAPDATKSRASELVAPIYPLLPRLCGEKYDAVDRQLLTGRAALLERGNDGLKAFRAKVSGLGIEEKAALLGTFRNRIEDLPSDDTDLDADDFFDQEDDEDEDWDGERSGREDLAAAHLFLLHSLLKDIRARQATLSQRDKKELVRVMEPALLRDFDFIADTLESSESLGSCLGAAITAGCAGPKTCLLALVAGTYFRDGELVKQGQKALDQLPMPTQDDFRWLCARWGELFYPTVRSLKPLLIRFEKEEPLLSILVTGLCASAEMDMTEYTLKVEKSWIPAALRSFYSVDPPDELLTLRRELQSLTEFRALDLVRHLLRCYSDGRYTVEANLCWLKALHSMQPDRVCDYMMRELDRYREAERKCWGMPTFRSFKSLRANKIEAALLFVQEHFDDLTRVSAEGFGSLLSACSTTRRLQPFTIRCSFVLKRSWSGGSVSGSWFSYLSGIRSDGSSRRWRRRNPQSASREGRSHDARRSSWELESAARRPRRGHRKGLPAAGAALPARVSARQVSAHRRQLPTVVIVAGHAGKTAFSVH